MTSNTHNKHARLARPTMGNFGRNEWAILGAPCTTIKVLADNIITALKDKFKIAYADTVHSDDLYSLPGRLASGAYCEYTDQLNHSRIDFQKALSPFEMRALFSGADMVLVNGNHQPAAAQVLIIDENKQASVQKRAAELTNVQLILLSTNAASINETIQGLVPDWQKLPVLQLDDTAAIVAFFLEKSTTAVAPLNGLVLAGGKSVRMGFDKTIVDWYGKEQRYYMADMLQPYCKDVFISCREGQGSGVDAAYNAIEDSFTGLGPFGAILTALREQPNSAWLVVATDMPLINHEVLNQLTEKRNTAAIATAFINAGNQMPEPLLSIWEPKSYPVLLSFLAQGYSCPRKVLMNADAALLASEDDSIFSNVNTPEDFEHIKHILVGKTIPK